jgi:hypothetical protein
MNLILKREKSTEKSTPGILYIDGAQECFTLEDVVREIPGALVAQWKIANVTAIPFGTYRVVIDASNRFKRLMPHVLGVPGFDGIRIHWGNTAENTEGCILLGAVRQNADVILESRKAFADFYPKLEAAIAKGEEVMLTIEWKEDDQAWPNA